MFRLILLLAASIVLWLLYAFAIRLGFSADAPIAAGLYAASLVVTALCTVTIAGRIALALLTDRSVDETVAPIVSSVVYGLLLALAVVVLTILFGGNPLTILTTSAIFTVFVGLAIQPTLSAVFAGMVLHLERRIVPGSWIDVGGSSIQVRSIGWRTVIGRTASMHTVIVPNSKVLNEAVLRRADDRPSYSSFSVLVPIAYPPHEVSDILVGATTMMPRIVATNQLLVMPAEILTDKGAIRYLVSYFIYNHLESPDIAAAVVQRFWYAFQRHRMSLQLDTMQVAAVPLTPSIAELVNTHVAGWHVESMENSPDLTALQSLIALPTQFAPIAVELGTILMYGPAEPIIVPRTHADDLFVLVDGGLEAHDNLPVGYDVFGDHADGWIEPLPVRSLRPTGRIARIAARLATDIGPAAEDVVRRLVVTSPDLPALCREAAEQIPDEHARHAFLHDVAIEPHAVRQPGYLFRVRHDLTGQLRPPVPLRSVHHATILALPREVCTRALRHAVTPPTPAASASPARS